jgi:hypothetical protein
MGIVFGTLAGLIVGFLAGLLTFQQKQKWYPNCGGTLQCLKCAAELAPAPEQSPLDAPGDYASRDRPRQAR